MAQTQIQDTANGRRIAFAKTEGRGPCIVFLGGYKSDMEGTKALHLEDWAARTGRAYLRLDYSGHGQSSGRFEDGCIGDWAEDAAEVIEAQAGPAPLLVGSSMGGWIALLVARQVQKISGFVGIAAAPDFTEDSFWEGFDDAQRAALERDGQVALPSDYGEPYIVTKRLIEDGRKQLVLRSPLVLDCPVRLLLGTADTAVPVDLGLRLLAHMDCADARLTLVKDADHRLSEPHELQMIETAIEDVLATGEAK